MRCTVASLVFLCFCVGAAGLCVPDLCVPALDKDKENALYWYGKAARQGDADAQARLEAF